MVPIITLILVLSLSIVITRVATVALTYTGLAKEVARFQSRSAFTGVGFTTNEAEKVVNHPVRRRILLLLMLFGNAGIVTVIASVVMTFISLEVVGGSMLLRMVFLIVGLAFVWVIASSKWIDRKLSKIIGTMLKKHTKLDVQDYADLLHMAGEYKVVELYIEENDWLDDKTLEGSDLAAEGFLVLGITRKDGKYIGAPNGAMKLLAGDTLIIYGRASAFEELDRRQKGPVGDREHAEAVAEQAGILEESIREEVAESEVARGD